jgi:hypothetical protein
MTEASGRFNSALGANPHFHTIFLDGGNHDS